MLANTDKNCQSINLLLLETFKKCPLFFLSDISIRLYEAQRKKISLSQKMESENQIQLLVDVVDISLHANALKKDQNPHLPTQSSPIGK